MSADQRARETRYADDYCRIEWDPQARVLVFHRSDRGFATHESARATLDHFLAEARVLVPRARGLLVDSRRAPLRSDPAFEALTGGAFDEVVRAVPRSAVLVVSATGKLQLNRLKRERGHRYELFDDEAAALAYLTDDASAARR